MISNLGITLNGFTRVCGIRVGQDTYCMTLPLYQQGLNKAS